MLHLGRVLLPLLSIAVVLPACRGGYYPTWHYVPAAEIHQIHIGERAASTETPPAAPANPAAEVTSRIVGILRPVGGLPRRLHARLDVFDRGSAPVKLELEKVRATPSGGPALEPETKGVIEVAPGERRTAEIYFPIPDPATLPNTSLLEIDLAWTIDVEGRSITSHATFRRGSTYYSAPYYWDDPWYYGRPYYYGYGYGYGPYYGPYYYGPWWHGGFTFVHCD